MPAIKLVLARSALDHIVAGKTPQSIGRLAANDDVVSFEPMMLSNFVKTAPKTEKPAEARLSVWPLKVSREKSIRSLPPPPS